MKTKRRKPKVPELHGMSPAGLVPIIDHMAMQEDDLGRLLREIKRRSSAGENVDNLKEKFVSEAVALFS